jgi:hypothetical protein
MGARKSRSGRTGAGVGAHCMRPPRRFPNPSRGFEAAWGEQSEPRHKHDHAEMLGFASSPQCAPYLFGSGSSGLG